jgi:hypothetical protein
MVVAMSSSSGMLNTNSDGSFHKPKSVQSVQDWEIKMLVAELLMFTELKLAS